MCWFDKFGLLMVVWGVYSDEDVYVVVGLDNCMGGCFVVEYFLC